MLFRLALQPNLKLEPSEVYAVFPYINMSPGLSWKRQWLLDGDVTAESDDTGWDEGLDGVTYTYLWDEEALEPGLYTLNLFIKDELVPQLPKVVG